MGTDTIIVERLADDLSAAFQVLRAPTIEYGVNAASSKRYPGSAGLRRKTLHRLLNDLAGAWEAGGIRQFVIITAHGQDPHQEALSTIRTNEASVRTVDIFSIPNYKDDGTDLPVHGGEVDTSLLLYLDSDLVALDEARDFLPSGRTIRRYFRGVKGAIPSESAGSLGHPSRASLEAGDRLYQFIYQRVATRVLSTPPDGS